MRASARTLTRVWTGAPLSGVPASLAQRLSAHPTGSPALRDASGAQTYGELRADAARVRATLQVDGGRVGVLHAPGRTWVHSMVGVWQARCVAVPLSPAYPPAALAPLIADADVCAVLADDALAHLVPSDVRVITPSELQAKAIESDDEVDVDDARMLLYTSGTTGKPKGVVWTERMLRTQMSVLNHAWRWSANDATLCVLPLHHVHGIVNVVLSALYAGARVDMHSRFEAKSAWDALRAPDAPSIVMGVPTVYRRLIEEYNASCCDSQASMRAAARRVRLFVCGSASLPTGDARAWREIAKQAPLERYGMTETGMLLSCDYDRREEGALGSPLPGVSARMKADSGELLVRGEGVFRQYWRREEATRAAFDSKGWFGTGDIVRYDEKRGVFTMLGRASTDVVKTGGYKVSALEVEARIREVNGVRDAAVVGISCPRLGQRLAGAVEATEEDKDGLALRVRNALAETLPRYKIPREIMVVHALPRNALGKVQKSAVQHWFGADDATVA